MTADKTDAAGRPSDLEGEFATVRAQFDTVPAPADFRALRRLAGRIDVVVHVARQNGRCTDSLTGQAVDPAVARELLELADPLAWQLDAAQLHQAEVVAAIPAHATWRTLTVAQRRALAAWRLLHPELTYGNVLRLGRETAKARLDLALSLRPDDGAGDEAPAEVESAGPEASADEDPAAIDDASPVTVVRSAPVPQPVTEILTPLAVMPSPDENDAPVANIADEADGSEPEAVVGGSVAARTESVNRPVSGDAPNATYAGIDGIDLATLEILASEGMQPPVGASGFIRLDPYAVDATLKEVVVSYCDKIEVRIPTGSIAELCRLVASFSSLDATADEELQVGQYVWFPDRDTIRQWVKDIGS